MTRKPVMVYLTMKGGVGKTTLAANVTRGIADRQKLKILLIDADSQCNLTQLFVSSEDLDQVDPSSIYQALAGHKVVGPSDLKTTVYTNPSNGSTIDLIRGSFETFRLAVDASPLIERRTLERFKGFIEQAQAEYDLIVIDTNPSATLVTMHALAVANFLVAPISYDKFSMRGIQLITSLLGQRYDWLTNPLRVRVVANRIRYPNDDRARERLQSAEKMMQDSFPELSRCFVPTFIRESDIIANEKRRTGFLADQSVPNPLHLRNLLDDFDAVATDLLATFRKAFGDEKNKPRSVIETMQRTYKSIFGGAVDRPQ